MMVTLALIAIAFSGRAGVDKRQLIPFRYLQTGSPFEYELLRPLYPDRRGAHSREEHGTIEHLLAMQVTPAEIMLAKVWLMVKFMVAARWYAEFTFFHTKLKRHRGQTV
jgi:hypothetical protein